MPPRTKPAKIKSATIPAVRRIDCVCGNCLRFVSDQGTGTDGDCHKDPPQWAGDGWARPRVDATDIGCASHQRLENA